VSERRRRPARGTPTGSPASPVVASRLRIFGLAVLCMKVALVPIVFDRTADLAFSVPKALFSHALAYVLLAVLIALLIRFGRSFLLWTPLHLAVLAFLVVNAIATVFAVDPFQALFGTHARMVGLGTIADGVVLYFAVVLLVRTRVNAMAVGGSVLVSSLVVLGYEAVQRAGRDPFIWNIESASRPFSTLGQTTSLALYLSVLVIAAIATAAFVEGLRWRTRILLVLYSGFLFGGLVVTQTRSALLGIIAGAAVLVGLTWLAHPNRRARVASVGGVIAATAALLLVLVFTPLGARVLATVDISASAEGDQGVAPRLEESTDVRLAFYRMAYEIVRERPVFGYGPDNFVVGVPKYRTDSEPQEVQQSLETSAHGWLSQVAATSGLAGLACFLGVVVVALVTTMRAGYRPVAWLGIGVLAAFLGAGLTTVNQVGTEWLFWIGLGAVGAATARPWPWQGIAEEPRSRRARAHAQNVFVQSVRSTAGYVVIGIGFLMALATMNALDASHAALASQQARLRPNLQLAIELGLRATSQDPRRAAYWDTLGLAYVGAQRTTDAVSAFKRAADLAPYDFRYTGDLARAYLELVQRGDIPSAARARQVADDSVALDPNNPRAQLTRAIVMQITGDLPEALRAVERALTLDPTAVNPQLHLTATQILLASGRPSDAIAMARRALAIFAYPQDQFPIRVELARALIANGQPTEAASELDAALAIRPTDATALQLRAQIR
jgi:O-antigen ligase/tetratricopeptide (TPR) repeat protein